MEIPVRRRLRWLGCDYSEPDSYFVTVCVQNRLALFGQIVEAEMKCNPAGEMVTRWWNDIPNRFTNVGLDESVVMPNHFHGILFFTRPESDATLSRVMNWFKTMTTNEYIRAVTTARWPPFRERLWQRSYYDRVIRNERELEFVRDYIRNNPAEWFYDRNNPDRNRAGRPHRAAPTRPDWLS